MTDRCVAVAWSGGRDSTALLHATLKAAEPLGLRVVALHIHHGLSPHADDWVRSCQRQAARWRRRGLPLLLRVERLSDAPTAGESVEAWAREQRYQALRRLALEQGARIVLLAHHRRDQAETFLLQALRGAGVSGLAAMPAGLERDGVLWLRPWLAHTDTQIASYVRRYRLRHVEDDSNADPRLARNRLRLQVWPALSAAFPGAEAALADSAAWSGEAAHCLEDLARLDLAAARDGERLAWNALATLSAARRSNALRHWLHERTGLRPPASLIGRLAREMGPRTTACWPLPHGELRAYRGLLAVHAGPATDPVAAREHGLSVDAPGFYPLPGWGGGLLVRPALQGGVPLAWLAGLDLRERSGAERFQAGPGRPPRSLKKQYQAAGVPAWQRAGPLLYRGTQLLFVPGLGLDGHVLEAPGQPRVLLSWQRLG